MKGQEYEERGGGQRVGGGIKVIAISIINYRADTGRKHMGQSVGNWELVK